MSQQITETPKKRRGRLPKKQVGSAAQLMSQMPSASFSVNASPAMASLNSAATLKNGAPNSLSPVMKVSPTRKRRASLASSTASTVSRPSSARSTPQSAARTETKTSPITPSALKTHAKLTTVLSSTPSKRDLSVVYEDDHRTPGLLLPVQLPHSNTNYMHVDPSMLLPSPMVKKRPMHSPQIQQQQTSHFAQQLPPSSPYYSPLTPTSHFSNVIRSSPMYNAYYNLPTTPVMRRHFEEPGDVVQLSVKPIKFEDIIRTPRGGVKIRESWTQPQPQPQSQQELQPEAHEEPRHQLLLPQKATKKKTTKQSLPVRLSLEVDGSGKAIIKRKSKSFSLSLPPKPFKSERRFEAVSPPKLLKLGSDPVLTTVASMDIDDYHKALDEGSINNYGETDMSAEEDACDARSALIDALA